MRLHGFRVSRGAIRPLAPRNVSAVSAVGRVKVVLERHRHYVEAAFFAQPLAHRKEPNVVRDKGVARQQEMGLDVERVALVRSRARPVPFFSIRKVEADDTEGRGNLGTPGVGESSLVAAADDDRDGNRESFGQLRVRPPSSQRGRTEMKLPRPTTVMRRACLVGAHVPAHGRGLTVPATLRAMNDGSMLHVSLQVGRATYGSNGTRLRRPRSPVGRRRGGAAGSLPLLVGRQRYRRCAASAKLRVKRGRHILRAAAADAVPYASSSAASIRL